jgi:predicted DNA-binding transcriptional regulator AlpA
MTLTVEAEQRTPPAIEHDRFIRYPELKHYGVPFSRQHFAAMESDGRFPVRVQLSARVIAWRLSEIQEWMKSRGRR